jgi:hypothetical protein
MSMLPHTARGSGMLVADGGKFGGTISQQQSCSYYVVAPLINGVALVGDAGKFISMGKQRIASLNSAGGRLTADVLFSPGDEPVVLHGYAETSPHITVTGGTAAPVKYDPATEQFSVTISPAGDMKGMSHAAVAIESK